MYDGTAKARQNWFSKRCAKELSAVGGQTELDRSKNASQVDSRSRFHGVYDFFNESHIIKMVGRISCSSVLLFFFFLFFYLNTPSFFFVLLLKYSVHSKLI